jgi:hypothetical protein
MGQFSMEKPALKGQFSVEINTLAFLRLASIRLMLRKLCNPA